ncbi:MAG: hypothetical protein ACREFN_04765, partial [Acetobacteraceae bacterium]
AGSGNDTVIGGTGINILFGGSGNDVLVGGANNDYLYGGTGSDTLSGGAGTNFLQSGSGPTTFLVSAQDSAQNTLNGFRPGIDQIDITGASGMLLGTAALEAMLSRATTDASGNAVLSLSATNTLTLNGVSLSELGMAIFGTALAPSISLPDPAGASSNPADPITEDTTLSAAGNDVTDGSPPVSALDPAHGDMVSGGTGGLDPAQTAGANPMSTSSSTTDTLNLVGSDIVSAVGNDTISASGSAFGGGDGSSMQFIGGTATSSVSVGSGNAAVTGGGSLGVTGGSGNMLVDRGSGATTVRAGTANVTLTGGSGALDGIGGSGFTAVHPDPGAATFYAGTGNNLFIVNAAKAASSAALSDFALGKNFISFHDLSTHPISSFASAGQTNIIALGDGTSIAVNFATH